MIYLPDTNALSAYLRNSSEILSERFKNEMVQGNLRLSIMVLAELQFGAYKAEKARGTKRYSVRIRELRQILEPEELTPEFPIHYARVRYALESKGIKIGERDTIIAAHALTLSATVVTRNRGEFGRVPGLLVENWENL